MLRASELEKHLQHHESKLYYSQGQGSVEKQARLSDSNW